MFQDITMQFPGMRKAQEFTLCPLAKGETKIILQSDRRIAQIDLETGKGMLSKACANPGFMHLNSFLGATPIELTAEQLQELKLTAIGNGDTISLAGGALTADNSGISAIRL